MHNIVRTRTGDQLHTQYVYTQDFIHEGKVLIPAGECRNRTSCGCRIARVLTGDVRVRPGLLCEKCFTPELIDRNNFNVKLTNGE